MAAVRTVKNRALARGPEFHKKVHVELYFQQVVSSVAKHEKGLVDVVERLFKGLVQFEGLLMFLPPEGQDELVDREGFDVWDFRLDFHEFFEGG